VVSVFSGWYTLYLGRHTQVDGLEVISLVGI